MRSFVRHSLGAAWISACAMSCSQSDVGAPCRHAGGDIPTEPLISFPALACDQLMCVFGDDFTAPADPCESSADCERMSGTDEFRCEAGRCVVERDAVLERSMCTTTCESDAECTDPVDGTRCGGGVRLRAPHVAGGVLLPEGVRLSRRSRRRSIRNARGILRCGGRARMLRSAAGARSLLLNAGRARRASPARADERKPTWAWRVY